MADDLLIVFAVAELARRVSDDFRRRAVETGLTYAQARALHHLDVSPNRSQSAVAGAMDISPAAVTQIVDGLVARGLVERSPIAGSRRTVQATLTPAAVSLLERLRADMAATDALALEGVDEADRVRVQAVLDRMNENLSRKRAQAKAA